MQMKKTGYLFYLVIGLIIFPIGLMTLLRVSPIFDLMNSISAGQQTNEAVGLVLQFVGEGLICFGIIGSISSRVIANAEYNRQMLVASTLQSIHEQDTLISTLRRSVDDQVTQLSDKINQIQSQRQLATFNLSPDKCRFCGGTISQGTFCPLCGRAN